MAKYKLQKEVHLRRRKPVSWIKNERQNVYMRECVVCYASESYASKANNNFQYY